MRLSRVLLCLAALSFAMPVMALDQTHKAWTGVLEHYQDKQGQMNYAALKADLKKNAQHPFSQYLHSLTAVKKKEFNGWPKADQMAFLINAYNAFTVKLIVDHYPVESIKDIGGIFSKPWSQEFFSLLEGDIKSLDPIEHKYLRPHYKDFRVHAAVNCASISCPPLRHEAFVGSKLDAQLNEQMRLWLADKSRNKYDPKTGELMLSKIFDWYEDDFKSWGGGVKKVVSEFGPPAANQALKKKGDIDYLDYNWSLNDTKAKKNVN